MAQKASRISELSSIIACNTAILDEHIEGNDNAGPLSFDFDGPSERNYPLDVAAARVAVEGATLEPHELVKHPRALGTDPPHKHAAKAFIAKSEIARLVPEKGSITGVNQGALEAICRLAIAHRIFTEPEEGHLAHSPASRHLAQDWAVAASKAFADDFYPISAFLARALEQHPEANEAKYAASALANGVGGEKSFYDMINQYPERASNFHSTMHLAQGLPGLSWEHLVHGYDWASLPDRSLCVDVGGGHGQAALAVSAKFPNLKWIVQDSVRGLSDHPQIPEGANFTYMEHDFLQPQPAATKGAKIFFMRWILHNWPDQYCHQILRGLAPSLESGGRVLIMEQLMPPPGGVSNMSERNLRSHDVGQLALGNGRERDRMKWQRLIDGTDDERGKFGLERVIEPEGSDLAILEVVWKA